MYRPATKSVKDRGLRKKSRVFISGGEKFIKHLMRSRGRAAVDDVIGTLIMLSTMVMRGT